MANSLMMFLEKCDQSYSAEKVLQGLAPQM